MWRNLRDDEKVKKEIDIVFSKKDNEDIANGIEYIKLGYLHDVIIASKESTFAHQKLTLENIEEQTIYTPRTYAQAVARIKELTLGKNLKLRNNDYKKFNLVEVKTTIELGAVEFGIYINSNTFKELNNLIKLIEEYFKV